MPTLNDLRKLHTDKTLVDPAVIHPLLDYLQGVEDRLDVLEQRVGARGRPGRPEDAAAGAGGATQTP